MLDLDLNFSSPDFILCVSWSDNGQEDNDIKGYRKYLGSQVSG
jgi:hypothetical protein